MPYIDQEARAFIKPLIGPIVEAFITKAEPGITAGELNYIFTRLAGAFLTQEGKSYASMNAVLGVFEAAKLEFYRRVVAPYENEKRHTNGEVY